MITYQVNIYKTVGTNTARTTRVVRAADRDDAKRLFASNFPELSAWTIDSLSIIGWDNEI
jgi:hypothetical protein